MYDLCGSVRNPHYNLRTSRSKTVLSRLYTNVPKTSSLFFFLYFKIFIVLFLLYSGKSVFISVYLILFSSFYIENFRSLNTKRVEVLKKFLEKYNENDNFHYCTYDRTVTLRRRLGRPSNFIVNYAYISSV